MAVASDIFLGLLALIFPPLPVWIKRGICSCDSLLNILLLMLAYVPGVLHAWYIIAKYPEGYERVPGDDDYEAAVGGDGTRVSYYYVSRGPGSGGPANAPLTGAGTGAPDGGKAQRQLQRGSSYGAISGSGESNAQAQAQSQGSSQAPAPTQPQTQAQTQNQGSSSHPPTYDEAIKGDHKVQKP